MVEMSFMYYLLLWVTLGVVGIFLMAKYYRPEKKNLKQKSKSNKISGYGGPELDLPPGIVLEEDDNDFHSENIRTRK